MRGLLKKMLYTLPRPFRTVVVMMRELYWQVRLTSWEKKHYPNLQKIQKRNGVIKNILIYHINGLTHAGTEKNLQLIANGLSGKYNVFYMYGDKTAEESRKDILDSRISLIPFSYESNEVVVPHKLKGMTPHIKEVIVDHDIDLIITASPGYAHYPWNVVTEIPIVLSNVFGAPSLQKNIVATIFMSETVLKHAVAWTGNKDNYFTQFLPIGKMPPQNTRELGSILRSKLGINETDFVFGRIGRDDDAIFDPIGILAWQKIAANYPQAHLLVMSPPPILVKMVNREKIPRVHLLPPSGEEEDVWAFHGAIDAMAHFRKDGETSGVAIAESLTIGNPIITHRSTIWNAHLEYLKENCSRIADIDSVEEYANYMKEFILLKRSNPTSWKKINEEATMVGFNNFSPDAYLEKVHAILQKI